MPVKKLLIDIYFDYVNQYTEEYGEKTVVFMQVGAFYEVYGKTHELVEGFFGSQVQELSNICDLKIANKANVTILDNILINGEKTKVKCNIVMAGFNTLYIDKYLEKMNNASYTCVVYKQNDECPNAPRELLGISTPGTFFIDNKQQISNNTMCIFVMNKKPSNFSPVHKIYYGISCIDVLSGHVNICENTEKYYKSYQSFNEIEKMCNVYKPSEILLMYSKEEEEINIINRLNSLFSKYTETIRNVNISDETSTLSKRAFNCCKQNYQFEIIKQYYESSNLYNEICNKIRENPCMINSFTFLLDFINKQNSDLINKIQFPKFNNNTEYLITENHSLTQLNIISDFRDKSKYNSLVSFLNQCVTSMGSRSFKDILTQPITNENKLQTEYDKIEYILENYDNTFENVRKHMVSLHDIEKFYRKISLNKVQPFDIITLYRDLEQLNKIHYLIKDHDELENYGMFKIVDVIHNISSLTNHIEENINIEILQNINQNVFETNFFNKGLNNLIDEIERKYIDSYDILQTIQQYFTELLKGTEKTSKNSDYCKIYETERDGLSLKMTNIRMKKLFEVLKKEPNEIELVYVSTYDKTEKIFKLYNDKLDKKTINKDAVIYSNQIQKIADNIKNLKTELKTMITNEFNKYIKELFNLNDEFKVIIQFIIELDVTITKTYLAKKYKYNKPIIKSEAKHSFIETTQMRHPLIEHINIDEIYVGHNISLGVEENIQEEIIENDNETERGILLFGTNAVGKSSLMKALGMCVIMAQCGCYVPCETLVYKPFTRIFTRILSNDNIFKGLSTFAVEMSELRNIIENADENSLIIGDELCSGTELGSAISIFVATLIKLHTIKSKFIFATHFHEVTKMEQVNELSNLKMKHLSVYYDKKLDTLVYDRILKDGPGNNMYGLEVCKAMNLKDDFIDLALDIRNSYVGNGEKYMSTLKPSHFNSNVIMNMCELCKQNPASEVHHLQHQKNADSNNMIGYIHKNKKANLASICEDCHDEIHRSNKQHIKKKTGKGHLLIEM